MKNVVNKHVFWTSSSVEVVVSAVFVSYSQSIGPVLTELRPDFPGMSKQLDVRRVTKENEQKEIRAKLARVVTTENGAVLTIDDIARMKPEDVLKTKMSAPRFGLFSLINQVKALTQGANSHNAR